MKLFLLALSCLLVPYLVEAAESREDAYLIIKASVSNTERQPSWICLLRAQRCRHISASDGLVKVEAGKYKLHHVDFAKSLDSGDTDNSVVTNKTARSGGATQYFINDLKFNFEPGLIYFLGDLELIQKKSRKYKIDLNQDTSLIIDICRAFPGIFEEYPVTDIHGSKKMKVSCR